MAEYKDNLLGEASSFFEVLRQVSHLAPLDKPVFIIGERGTDKGLVASRLHYLSSRQQGPFISPNCVALNENLLDSKLFDREAGTFTGAQKRHPERFERADGGTLFLDKLATALMMMQEELLRMIECGELEHVGGSQPLQVNMRLICVTNIGFLAMVNGGTFHAGLLDRLAFDVVRLSPLHERESDIISMAEYLAIQMCREIKLPLLPGFMEHARETLLNYRWPRNIRESKSVVEHSVHRHGTSNYPLDDIIIGPSRWHPPKGIITVSETASPPILLPGLRGFQMQQEKELLQLSLQQGKYNQKRVTELLGLTCHQFYALLKKHQIQRS